MPLTPLEAKLLAHVRELRGLLSCYTDFRFKPNKASDGRVTIALALSQDAISDAEARLLPQEAPGATC